MRKTTLTAKQIRQILSLHKNATGRITEDKYYFIIPHMRDRNGVLKTVFLEIDRDGEYSYQFNALCQTHPDYDINDVNTSYTETAANLNDCLSAIRRFLFAY